MTEEQIFEHLFRTHYQDLCQYAAHYVSDPQIVEDIVQGFFVTIWENKTLSANVHHFQSYAQRAIHNRCLNYYKAELSKENFLALFLEEWKEMQQERDDFPHKERIQAALHRLPPQCKRVFLLRCLKNMNQVSFGRSVPPDARRAEGPAPVNAPRGVRTCTTVLKRRKRARE